MITWDELKRQANLDKQGLDFADAWMVYSSPDKITLESPRNSEDRKLDLALVDVRGIVLALVYVERGVEVRAISLRRASKTERRIYENAQQD